MINKIKSNIWKYYLHKIFFNAFFSIPVIVLFWEENGLSLTEIMILQSLFSIAVVILEIPTGYFADVFGKRKTFIISSFLIVFAITIYSFGHNFYQFLICEILFAIGLSFSSGTDSAFIYDTLRDIKQENTYKKIWGNSIFYGMISSSIAYIIGGFIGEINLRWTLFVSIPFFFMLIPISLSFKEPKHHKHIIENNYMYELFKILKFILVENKKLKWLIIYFGIVAGFNQAALWLYQPYFKLSGLNIAYFGIIFSSFQLVSGISAKYADKIEKQLGNKYSLIILVFLVGISQLLMSNYIFLFSFSFIFLQQFVRGFSDVVITDYINKITESNIRATVLSVNNLVYRLVYALVIPFIGLIADIYNILQALTVLGITTLIIGILTLFMLHKNKVF